MIDNKIANRITKSTRNKAQKEDDRIMEETEQIIIPPEKREQIIKDYSDAYILVKGTITVNGVVNGAENDTSRRNRPLILKNSAPFVSCITRINGKLIEDADDLDIVMPMYNLLEYSKNYRKTIASLYNYCRDELSDDKNPNNFPNINVVNSGTFKYKNKIIGNTYNVTAGNDRLGTKKIELAIPLKYLGNFWRALNIPLISCDVFLELKWNKSCIITSLEQRQVNAGPPVVNGTTTGTVLAINDCKLYVPVVTSKDDEIKLLTNLKSGFKREIIWNRYRSQMTTKAANNNLNILIDPTFTNVNRLFVLAYPTANNNRQSFFRFYLPSAMVKGYNVIIDKLAFFDLPIKTEEEAYEEIIDNGRNNEYTTGNLLDYDYFKKHYKLIAIDLSKQQVLQENEDLIQQINFIGRLTEAANVFIIIEKKENTILEFSQNFANVIYK